MLTLNNLSCTRAGRVLFTGLGFTLGDCCVLIIKGDNGAGKTSLLDIIACLAQPSTGEILYANENVQGEHWPEYCEIIQYIGHKNATKPQLTPRQNITFWARLTDSVDRVNAALSFFDLQNVADIPCAKLSIGWQKKVALAKLLACRSEIWLLDEPFANLDESTKLKLASLINTRREQGGSVIIASHEETQLENAHTIDLKDFAPR